jgi:hypothetical protein
LSLHTYSNTPTILTHTISVPHTLPEHTHALTYCSLSRHIISHPPTPSLSNSLAQTDFSPGGHIRDRIQHLRRVASRVGCGQNREGKCKQEVGEEKETYDLRRCAFSSSLLIFLLSLLFLPFFFFCSFFLLSYFCSLLPLSFLSPVFFNPNV